MPAGVDEAIWKRAKAAAAKQGKGKNWSYVMGIYQQIAGRKDMSKAFRDLPPMLLIKALPLSMPKIGKQWGGSASSSQALQRRGAQIGEVHDWHGQKFKKVAEGKWEPVTGPKAPTKGKPESTGKTAAGEPGTFEHHKKQALTHLQQAKTDPGGGHEHLKAALAHTAAAQSAEKISGHEDKVKAAQQATSEAAKTKPPVVAKLAATAKATTAKATTTAKPSSTASPSTKPKKAHVWRDTYGHLNLTKYPPVDAKNVTVNMSGDVHSHAVLTWLDAKGRRQAAYTSEFAERNAAVKWQRVARMLPVVDSIKAKIGNTWKTSTDPQTKESAIILDIISRTGLRVGGVAHEKATGSRGVTTLRAGDVTVTGSTIEFDFIGKEGVRNQATIVDESLAKEIQSRKAGGDRLFSVTDANVRDALKEISGDPKIKVKDFRTHHATVTAAEKLSSTKPPPPLPEDQKKAARLVKRVLSETSAAVAKTLNNTPAMARSSYIHPHVIDAWLDSIGAKNLGELSKSQSDLLSAAMRKHPPVSPSGPVADLEDIYPLPKRLHWIDDEGESPLVKSQLDLFGAPKPRLTIGKPEKKPKDEKPKVQVGGNRPPGEGWQPIPESKHGGFRRRSTTAGEYGRWEYWYPQGDKQPELVKSMLLEVSDLIKAEQLSLFGTNHDKKTSTADRAKPPGSGWQSIPRGTKGGFRRRASDGSWEYWYAAGHKAEPKAPRQPVRIETTAGQLAEALWPGASRKNWVGMSLGDDKGNYPGTNLPVRRFDPSIPVVLVAGRGGGHVESEQTWIADRFGGGLGVREVKQAMATLAAEPRAERRVSHEPSRAVSGEIVAHDRKPPEMPSGKPRMTIKQPVPEQPKTMEAVGGLPFEVSPLDLPTSEAAAAHSGSSWTPDVRAGQEQQSYVNAMRAAWERFGPQAKTPEQQAALLEELHRYRLGYLSRLRAKLSAQSRTMSTMIAGPSKFPVARNRKRLETEHKRLVELLEWNKKALGSISKKLQSMKVADAGGPMAVMAKEIEVLESQHRGMKHANQIIRSKSLTDDQKVAKLRDDLNISETVARDFLKPDFAGRIGFPDYKLTNNLATIKRKKERLAELQSREKAAEEPDAPAVEGEGWSMEESREDNRLRLFFDSKPSDAQRSALRGSGWKWSPHAGAWQRQLTNNARASARQILKDHFGAP